MSIDRFDSADIMWSLDGNKLSPSAAGQWVRYSDHVAAATAKLVDAADRAEVLQETISSYSQVISAKQRRIDALEAMAAEPAEPIEQKPDAPISQLVRDTGKPEWEQIVDLFLRNRLPAPHTQLRDKLSTMLAWARYGEARAKSDQS